MIVYKSCFLDNDKMEATDSNLDECEIDEEAFVKILSKRSYKL